MRQWERRRIWLAAYHAPSLEQSPIPPLSIRWIDPSIGYGLFAKKYFPRGVYIGEYTGRVRAYLPLYTKRGDYSWLYLPPGTFFPLYLFVDAGEYGNFTRFINHAEISNLESILVPHGSYPRILLLTKREIAPEEQLTLNYGDKYWQSRKKKPLSLNV